MKKKTPCPHVPSNATLGATTCLKCYHKPPEEESQAIMAEWEEMYKTLPISDMENILTPEFVERANKVARYAAEHSICKHEKGYCAVPKTPEQFYPSCSCETCRLGTLKKDCQCFPMSCPDCLKIRTQKLQEQFKDLTMADLGNNVSCPDYKKKYPKGNFINLIPLWEMGLYPCGMVDGKFIVYIPKK